MDPYRDKELACPRCGKQLAPYPDRDKWRCKQCNGALVGVEQLTVEIGPHARAVLEGEADPARAALHPCPRCAYPMTPYTIGTIELDRCVADQLVWFDGGEIGKIRAAIPSESDSPLVDSVAGYLALTRREELVPAAQSDDGTISDLPIDPRTPMTDTEWRLRLLCVDGACNGVVANGRCKVCGTATT